MILLQLIVLLKSILHGDEVNSRSISGDTSNKSDMLTGWSAFLVGIATKWEYNLIENVLS